MSRIFQQLLFSLAALLLLVGVSCSRLQAQSLLVPVSTGIPSLPDTVNMGDTINFDYYIVNLGVASLVSPLIQTFMEVNGQVLPQPVSVYQVAGLFLMGDTMKIPVNNFVVSPSNNNNGGANVVVIWPTAPGATPKDSASGNMYVRNPNSVFAERGPALALNLFPNPAHDRAWVDFFGDPQGENSILLCDLNGRILRSWKPAIGQNSRKFELDLSGLNPGFYLLEVRAGKARGVRRLILE
ncbi:MAG: T9SS type A sorting domain-containing protein [Bacteroidia bacterium]|nr:T9SS type A sorting domain-containing protein [Bacteroidia bacterium]